MLSSSSSSSSFCELGDVTVLNIAILTWYAKVSYVLKLRRCHAAI